MKEEEETKRDGWNMFQLIICMVFHHMYISSAIPRSEVSLESCSIQLNVNCKYIHIWNYVHNSLVCINSNNNNSLSHSYHPKRVSQWNVTFTILLTIVVPVSNRSAGIMKLIKFNHDFPTSHLIN